jgi:predicted trehalose synthase
LTVTLAEVELGALARAYLDRQHWFQLTVPGARANEIELIKAEMLREQSPPLCRLLLGCRGRHFGLFSGWRDARDVSDALHGREGAIFGSAVDGSRTVLVYDALADDELAVELFRRATRGRERAARVRQLATAVSHASLVYDGRFLMKCYRVLEDATRPEIEVVMKLDAVGFNAMLAPVAAWQSDGFDLALVREFLPSALEGRLLALTSLRDLLARVSGYERGNAAGAADLEPEGVFDAAAATASAGGDLASEMRRLGSTAAGLHLALGEAFGTTEVEPAQLADEVAQLLANGSRTKGAGGRSPDPADLVARVRSLRPGEAGSVIRVHGDFHLRRVMRAETGWVVVGFGDDPLFAESLSLGSLVAHAGTPLEDLADMWFSIGRVAREALAQRPSVEAEPAGELARAWVRRNRLAFLEGYVAARDVGRLLPSDAEVVGELVRVLTAARERRYGTPIPEA